jgi:alpha-mannosidase
MYKILRRGSGRVLILCIVVLSLLLCLYYVSQVQAPSTGHPAAGAAILNEELRYDRSLTSVTPDYSESPDAQVSLATCPIIVPRNADIDAQQEFGKFDFQVSTPHSFAS